MSKAPLYNINLPQHDSISQKIIRKDYRTQPEYEMPANSPETHLMEPNVANMESKPSLQGPNFASCNLKIYI